MSLNTPDRDSPGGEFARLRGYRERLIIATAGSLQATQDAFEPPWGDGAEPLPLAAELHGLGEAEVERDYKQTLVRHAELTRPGLHIVEAALGVYHAATFDWACEKLDARWPGASAALLAGRFT